MNVPPKAIKCLTLALNDAAPEGEWNAAAIMFCSILRRNGILPEHIFLPPDPDPIPEPARSTAVMPFGKFKHHQICDLPDWYLEWCLEQDFIKPALRSEIEREFSARQ